MHGGVIEAIFHCSPGIAKHLGPFSGTVDFHAHVKVDPTARGFGPAAGSAAASSSSRSRICRSAADGNRINPIAFAEEQRATISRNIQIRYSSAKTEAAATFAFRRWTARNNARQPLAIFLDRVDYRYLRRRRRLRSYEHNRPTVGRNGRSEERRVGEECRSRWSAY